MRPLDASKSAWRRPRSGKSIYSRHRTAAVVDRARANTNRRPKRAARGLVCGDAESRRFPTANTSGAAHLRLRYVRSARSTRQESDRCEDAGVGRLRLRQHDRQGCSSVGRERRCCLPVTRSHTATRSRTPRICCGRSGKPVSRRSAALALTGYGKDLLNDILGADVSVVETVAHARAALHFFPDADVICDVGGCDIKVMILRNGTVADFRLNSQCSSGNGAFLQGVAERYGVPLENYADRAFRAKSLPHLAMGCGVFLQSDIVNQQRKGWSAEEIMASLAAVLPLNVWVYAGQLQNLRAVGRKFVLQGGTHRNAAVVKAQVDFITGKVPGRRDRDPSLFGRGRRDRSSAYAQPMTAPRPSRFAALPAIEALTYRTTTNDHTVCHWCSCNCKRTFIDVQLPERGGRPGAKCRSPKAGNASSAAIPVPRDWSRTSTKCGS